jgi:hypothetical protein
MHTEEYWHDRLAIRCGQFASSSELEQGLRPRWDEHTRRAVESELSQTWCWWYLRPQPNGVDTNVGQIEQRLREVSANEGATRMWV